MNQAPNLWLEPTAASEICPLAVALSLRSSSAQRDRKRRNNRAPVHCSQLRGTNNASKFANATTSHFAPAPKTVA